MTNKIQHFPSRLWRLLALALPLAACTSEVTDEALPGSASPIAFRTAEMTKAVVDDNNPMTEFSVWGWYGDANTQVFNKQLVTNTNGAGWTYSPYQYWVEGQSYRFYAVYPTNVGNCDADGTITVSNFDCSQGVDLMTADNTGISYKEGDLTKAVSFTFRHELARVNIVVQVDPGVTVTGLSATLEGFHDTGTLTRTAIGASWDLDSRTADGELSLDQSIDIPQNSSQDLFGDLLLIPQSTEGITLTLELTRDGSPVKYTARFDESLTAWSAGHPYRYVLHIKVDAITFSNFTTDDWGETHTGGDINIGGGTNDSNQGN